MPDSGHGSHFQFPEAFAEATVHFFAADLHPWSGSARSRNSKEVNLWILFVW